jgi:hypothetical protein
VTDTFEINFTSGSQPKEQKLASWMQTKVIILLQHQQTL